MKTEDTSTEPGARPLRRLVAAGRYREAQAEFEAYASGVAESLAGLSPGDPRAARLQDEYRRLLLDTRRRVLAGRAHAAGRLARLAGVRQPYAAPAAPRRSWQYFA
jgi:hypothetical protein